MSEDQFTTVTQTSWISRIGSAISGLLFGLLLFVLSFPVLFWNEGRAVATARGLTEGAGATVSVDAARVDPANEGRPVHVSGAATAKGLVQDELLGVAVADALRLERVVEMYQWRERSSSKTEKELGGSSKTTKTTTYDKEWSASPISSSSFAQPAGHANPTSFPLHASERRAEQVNLGAFTLSPAQVDRIPATEPVRPPVLAALQVPEPLRSQARISDSLVFFGADPGSPAVGDFRVSFRAAKATEVSLVAVQRGTTFEPFVTSDGQSIDLIKLGHHTAAQLFAQEQTANQQLTWILRGVGFVVMCVGLALILRPLSVLGDVIPFVGNLLEGGVMLISGAVAGVLSTCTIAVAWIVYRPYIGLGLLVLAGGLAFIVHRHRPQKLGLSAEVGEG